MKSKQLVGVEYELEGLYSDFDTLSDEMNIPDHWRIEHDGTLRGNAAEFVSDPILLADASDIVNGLLESIDEYNVSHRCSTHIHVGVDGMIPSQRLALYMLLVSRDNFFFQYDPERKRNHFCTPMLHSPAFYQGLGSVLNSPNWAQGRPDECRAMASFRRPQSTNCKYNSVNVMPCMMGGIGTMELRHFSPLMEISQVDTILSELSDITSQVRGITSKTIKPLLKELDEVNAKSLFSDEVQWTISAVRSALKLTTG